MASRLTRGHGYVQIKDVVSPSDPTPALVGQGSLPLPEVLRVLGEGGYVGPLSVEWERAWYPEIPDLRAAVAAVAGYLRKPHPYIASDG